MACASVTASVRLSFAPAPAANRLARAIPATSASIVRSDCMASVYPSATVSPIADSAPSYPRAST